MKKDEVVRAISAQTGLPRGDVSLVLDAFVGVVKHAVVDGSSVHFRGFGSFLAKRRAAKIARDIGRNTAVFVEACSVPSFRPSPSFVRQVKEGTVSA